MDNPLTVWTPLKTSIIKLYLLSCKNNKVRSDLNNLVVVAAINCQIKDKGDPLQILVNQDLDGKYLPGSKFQIGKIVTFDITKNITKK